MALIPFTSSYPNLLQLSVKPPSPSLPLSVHYLLFGSPSPCPIAWPFLLQKSGVPLLPVAVNPSSSKSKIKCFTAEEDRLNQTETLAAENVGTDDDEYGGIEDPNSVDPSLFFDKLGAVSSGNCHLCCPILCIGFEGQFSAIYLFVCLLTHFFPLSCSKVTLHLCKYDFIVSSLQNDLVVEAALLSRIQRMEQRLMDVEPRVQTLLQELPYKLTANILEQFCINKQTLVELGSRAVALRQMLLDLLEDPHEIRRICIMGRNCTLIKGTDDMECSVPLEKLIAEEEEEIEMLLENYLRRCESCHGQAEWLLNFAKEMEDSIAVNLSSRRLEVNRVELLQVGTFCVAVGALVAVHGFIHVKRLKTILPAFQFAFWLTTTGIIVGGVVAFFLISES
ncbi:Magnesium transporter MRS2-A [Hibiscus syriacus]|uniref:Magnesium transporter MRS2-A n=1 Tax=Hibiscus syriacus TaxID=106335 RepID=A0A6A3CEB2_HIBSY|nr:Magnesium transporter MRS2-A [Hibiscus syriacus]